LERFSGKHGLNFRVFVGVDELDVGINVSGILIAACGM
jgi:hypothetical protein